MKEIWTLGSDGRRTKFKYSGDCKTVVTIEFTGKPKISKKLFDEALSYFRGRTIHGGFSMTDPTSGGFGEWVMDNSKKIIGRKLTPRHASFIAAIMVDEGIIKSDLDGNAVRLYFPK